MLVQFLRHLARTPFVWGQTDCALVLADWHVLNHGFDPAAHLRGSYSTQEECAAYLAAHGHLPRVIARIAGQAGLARTRDPQPGDIAVIRFGRRWWGAIRTPRGLWAVKGHDGLTALSCDAVAAWRI